LSESSDAGRYALPAEPHCSIEEINRLQPIIAHGAHAFMLGDLLCKTTGAWLRIDDTT
jgi:hypothetical protein